MITVKKTEDLIHLLVECQHTKTANVQYGTEEIGRSGDTNIVLRDTYDIKF